MKKLYRSKDERIIAGVLGGLGEHLNIDPTILRLLYLFVTVFTAFVPGILFYLLAAAIMPQKGETTVASKDKTD